MLCPGHPLCLFVSCSAHTCSNSCFRQVDDQTPNNPQQPSQIRHDMRCYDKFSWILNPAIWQKKNPQAENEHALSVFLKNEPKAEGWSLIMDELESILQERKKKTKKKHLSFHIDSQAESVCMKLILSHKILLHHDDNLFKHCLIGYILHSSRIRLSV